MSQTETQCRKPLLRAPTQTPKCNISRPASLIRSSTYSRICIVANLRLLREIRRFAKIPKADTFKVLILKGVSPGVRAQNFEIVANRQLGPSEWRFATISLCAANRLQSAQASPNQQVSPLSQTKTNCRKLFRKLTYTAGAGYTGT
jgi:hypothetical protein